MIITIIAASVAPLPAKTDAIDTSRFLACIAAVEGHAWSDAGGAYAIQPATWRQHSPHKAYRLASVPLHADGGFLSIRVDGRKVIDAPMHVFPANIRRSDTP